MRNIQYFKGKKISIIGLGRSGLAAALLLNKLGAQLYVSDYQDTSELKANTLRLKEAGIKNIELGAHNRSFIEKSDLIVVSPGVSNKSESILWAEKLKIPIISEIELGFMLCPAKIIATTGTNGKTTVTTLIGRLIQKCGQQAFICGNIGRPFCLEVEKMQPEDYVSLEVSSFQLERIKTFKPYISLILNFTPDHLDRYASTQEYLEAKKRIFLNQDKHDYVILNYEDSVLRELAKEIKANLRYFKNDPLFNPNQAAVLEVAKILGIDQDVVNNLFQEFKGIEHRLEWVGQIKGVDFINDSKATNVDSTLWALRNIAQPIILIAGGRDKGIDYKLIQDLAKQKVKMAILIGEAKNKIKAALGDILPCEEADSLAKAVYLAYKKASSGDCVLLSPMCASFDMFKNYEERGNIFKEIVKGLQDNKIYA